MKMADEGQVLVQWQSFQTRLGGLLDEHRDQWVVYLDGPRYFDTTERGAMRWAATNLGLEAPFVVAQVQPSETKALSAAARYRFMP